MRYNNGIARTIQFDESSQLQIITKKQKKKDEFCSARVGNNNKCIPPTRTHTHTHEPSQIEWMAAKRNLFDYGKEEEEEKTQRNWKFAQIKRACEWVEELWTLSIFMNFPSIHSLVLFVRLFDFPFHLHQCHPCYWCLTLCFATKIQPCQIK